MVKKTKQDQDLSVTNAYSLFVYAIRSRLTRDYYLRRLRTFFNFIKLLPSSKIEQRCNHFATTASKIRTGHLVKLIVKNVVNG
jgi:hypothetical protein